MLCPKCGRTVEKGTKFCEYCGAHIGAQQKVVTHSARAPESRTVENDKKNNSASQIVIIIFLVILVICLVSAIVLLGKVLLDNGIFSLLGINEQGLGGK